MGERLRSLAIVLANVAALLIGQTLHAAAQGLAPVTMAPSGRGHSDGARIWYREGHYPQLSLPGGRREVVRSLLNITRPMHFGDYVWDDSRIPMGRVWVRVDLSRQLLSVFRDGHEIGSAVILYGSDHTVTPTGSFTILQKAQDYYSRTYRAPMPYMLRLTKDGVAIHGSNVREGWATHGCVGVPLDFARLLFAQAGKGDLVVILPAQS